MVKRFAFKRFSTNKTVFLLTLSDIFTWGFVIVINTLAGIYLADKLGEDVVRIVGIGASIYYLVQSLVQIPIGFVLDRIDHDRDEIIVLVIGCILMGFPFLFYPAITSAEQYYVLMVIFGVGSALNLNSWRTLFAKNLDKGNEAIEYGLYGTVISFMTAIFSAIGGTIANVSQFYFDAVMVVLGLLVMTGGIWAAFVFSVKNRRSQE